MTEHQQLLQSRIETLQSLFNIIKAKLINLDPLDALDYTQPLSDELLRTAHDLVIKEKQKENMQQVDNILDNALKNKE